MLLHQHFDIKLVRLLYPRAVRSTQLQTAGARAYLLYYCQRLCNVFACLLEVAALLLRSSDTLQDDCSVTQVPYVTKYCKCLCKRFQRLVRLVQSIVDLTKINQRKRFATNVSNSTLNLNSLTVILQGLFILAFGGNNRPDLIKCLGFLRTTAGFVQNGSRLVKVIQSFLIVP